MSCYQDNIIIYTEVINKTVFFPYSYSERHVDGRLPVSAEKTFLDETSAARRSFGQLSQRRQRDSLSKLTQTSKVRQTAQLQNSNFLFFIYRDASSSRGGALKCGEVEKKRSRCQCLSPP